MKKRILQLTLCIAALIIMQCGDDDKPQVVPVVTTQEASNITPSSVVLNGEITNEGNAAITGIGFVYSSTIGTPTLAEEKVELADVDGDFTALLEGLNSGTTYHVRAYATNSVGTGYGNVVNVTTGNAGPTVKNISIAGSLEVYKTVTAMYSYSDPEGDAESGTTFQWYVANDGTGTGEMSIAGATASAYAIEEAQQGKYLRVGITPRAVTGNTAGIEVKSAFVGGVGEATTVTFTYNNKEVTYGIINSITTGKKWLDRNLGAKDAASAFDNYSNYGDLFQWGRLADGHQLIIRGGSTNDLMSGVNGPTSFDPPYQLSSTDDPGTSLFIVNPNTDPNDPIDWRTPQNDNLWQGVSGINNPCPPGWRVPTIAEWEAEGVTSLADGYAKLKLTYTSVRTGQGNAFFQSTSYGNYWSSSIGTDNPKQAKYIRFNSSSSEVVEQPRANGYACRCVKN